MNNPIEVNLVYLRATLELIAERRTSMFQLRSLTSRHPFLTGHICSHYMKHLLDAGLVKEYSFGVHRSRSGRDCKRNIIYQRCFDGESVDFDRWMEVMVDNDVCHRSECRVSHIR